MTPFPYLAGTDINVTVDLITCDLEASIRLWNPDLTGLMYVYKGRRDIDGIFFIWFCFEWSRYYVVSDEMTYNIRKKFYSIREAVQSIKGTDKVSIKDKILLEVTRIPLSAYEIFGGKLALA